MPLIMTVLVAFLTSFSTGEGDDGVWVCVWGMGVGGYTQMFPPDLS